jgi:ABC-type transport system involved in cytochrome c biogenesis permease subunit
MHGSLLLLFVVLLAGGAWFTPAALMLELRDPHVKSGATLGYYTLGVICLVAAISLLVAN